ncbi:MAG TPA: hypothetical protein DCG12_22975 [Planctomycetaceae bacterium]|nr:hypothetical protein [Planctomycetaceae bacterium]
MLNSLKFLLIPALVSISTSISAQEQDLFSTVRSGDVFATAPQNRVAAPGRITSANQIRERLNRTGFQSEVTGSREVELKKSLDPFTFPILISLSPDESSISIVMGLRSMPDTEKLDKQTLLRMMQLSQKHAPIGMGWNHERSRTEFYTVLRNVNLTGERLRETINRMAVIAVENQPLWFKESPKTTQQQLPISAEKLIGKWAASRSNTEAFAIEFSAGNRFVLVYANGTSQTRSEGTWSITNGQLALNGTGFELRGWFEFNSGTSFRFAPPTGSPLSFEQVSSSNN